MAATRPPLVCVECGAEADAEAARWRAYLTPDDELAVYCTPCAERELGIRCRTSRLLR